MTRMIMISMVKKIFKMETIIFQNQSDLFLDTVVNIHIFNFFSNVIEKIMNIKIVQELFFISFHYLFMSFSPGTSPQHIYIYFL